MTTYVIRDGKLIEKHLAAPIDCPNSASYIIRDTIDPLWHPATGRVIDSKSKFRRETKQAGCIEVGDQRGYGSKRLFTPKLDNRQRREDIQKVVYQLRNGIRSGN